MSMNDKKLVTFDILKKAINTKFNSLNPDTFKGPQGEKGEKGDDGLIIYYNQLSESEKAQVNLDNVASSQARVAELTTQVNEMKNDTDALMSDRNKIFKKVDTVYTGSISKPAKTGAGNIKIVDVDFQPNTAFSVLVTSNKQLPEGASYTIRTFRADGGANDAKYNCLFGETYTIQRSEHLIGVGLYHTAANAPEESYTLTMSITTTVYNQNTLEETCDIVKNNLDSFKRIKYGLTNGSVPNAGNAYIVSSYQIDVRDISYIQFEFTKPLAPGCYYNYGWYGVSANGSSVNPADLENWTYSNIAANGWKAVMQSDANQDKGIVNVSNCDSIRLSVLLKDSDGTNIPLRVATDGDYGFRWWPIDNSINKLCSHQQGNVIAVSGAGINGSGKTNVGKRFTMLVMTDVHGDKERLSQAIQYLNQTDVIDVGVNLGDMTASHYSDNDGSWYSQQVAKAKKPFITVLGNHQRGINLDPAQSGTTQQVYQKWIIPNMGKTGIDSIDKTYYYIDYPSYKIRCVIMDCFEVPDDMSNGNFIVNRSIQAYTQAQINWLIDTLNTTPSGYTLAILTHNTPGKGIVDTNINFNTLKRTNKIISQEDKYNEMIPTIMNAWINGGTVNQSFVPTLSTLPTINVNATFEGNKLFAGYFVGHQHGDLIGYCDAYPEQHIFCFATTCHDNYQNANWDLPRITNTYTQHAISVVSIDTTNTTVYGCRVGSDVRTDLRKVEPFAIKYTE